MPRLLLVDDNPSIHRIAESLLAPTDVELVCVDSAAEALDRLERGERFDVALVDTAMPGMDGWTLLSRLRTLEATAQMPIALMAGVLDPVDPAKLAKAPVQGFLKKPIELRELGDRVKTLLATPVPPPEPSPSPFATVPATPARDLMDRAEPRLPEFRPEVPDVSALDELAAVFAGAEPHVPEPVAAAPVAAALAEATPAEPEPMPEADLLVLTAEDLWPEEAPVPEAPVDPAPSVRLELEELDLDNLQDFTASGLEDGPAEAADLPPLETFDEAAMGTLSGLEELDGIAAELEAPLPAGDPSPAFPAEPVAFDPPAAEALPEAAAFGAPEPPAALAPPVPVSLAVEPPAAGGQAPAPVGQAPEPAGGASAEALVQALLADPAAMDALAKALVARLGEQALKEVAWEVMPELAGRLRT